MASASPLILPLFFLHFINISPRLMFPNSTFFMMCPYSKTSNESLFLLNQVQDPFQEVSELLYLCLLYLVDLLLILSNPSLFLQSVQAPQSPVLSPLPNLPALPTSQTTLGSTFSSCGTSLTYSTLILSNQLTSSL